MLTKIKEFVKNYQSDIILLIGVILISLLSFALGVRNPSVVYTFDQ